MAGATNPQTVQYGSFTLDETNGIALQGRDQRYKSDVRFPDGGFSIDFTVRLVSPSGVTATDDTAFGNFCNAAELALSTPNLKLLVKFGAKTHINFDPTPATLSAFNLRATCTKSGTQDDTAYTRNYRFSVTYEKPSTSARGYRGLDSTTDGDTPLEERRSEALTGTWTAYAGQTCEQAYASNAPAWFASRLPANVSGHVWIVKDEKKTKPDHDGFLTATRLYWEVTTAGLRSARLDRAYTLQGRRVCALHTTYVKVGSTSALDAYDANIDSLATALLPANLPGATWEIATDDPSPDDRFEVCTATRTYWEVVNGLREYSGSLTKGPNQAPLLTIEGLFIKTQAGSAQDNYDANIGTIVSAIQAMYGGAYDAKASRLREVPNTTGEELRFFREYPEILYPQGPDGDDDPNVVGFTLDVGLKKPFAQRTLLGSIQVLPLQRCTAFYSADIDRDGPGADDLENLWATRFKAHAVNAILAELHVPTAIVIDDQVTCSLSGPTGKRINAVLELVVPLTNVIAMSVSERIRRKTGKRPVPMADGTPHSYFVYDGPPERRLFRTATATYIAGTEEPTFFPSNAEASGLKLVDTGRTIWDALDAQEKTGDFGVGAAGGWIAIEGDVTRSPVSQGENGELPTITIQHSEEWLWSASVLNPLVAGAGAGGTVSR